MALARLQHALAALCTDEAARALRRDDPAGFARAFGLDAADVAQLAGTGADGARIGAFASALDRKRANEAARLLPLAALVLGPAFRAAFLRYARGTPLDGGPHRYRDDAIRFARAMRGEPLLAFAADGLAARGSALRLRVGAYACDVAAAARGDVATMRAGRSIAIWTPLRAAPFVFRMPVRRPVSMSADRRQSN